jgi:hypothetical protein
MSVQLAAVRLDQPRKRILIAVPRSLEELALVRREPGACGTGRHANAG